MAGDYTRWTFDPLRDFTAVFLQQGRVTLDSDFNELVEMLLHHLRTTVMDIMGTAAVPRETPEGFAITADGDDLWIGPGRAYIDGIMVDNHGAPQREFDTVTEGHRSTNPYAYSAQPFLPSPPPLTPPIDLVLPATGRHVVYVDVWDREVTWVEDPALLDPALKGRDTATRRQTVWQVRVLADDAGDATCDTPDEKIPGWATATAPSTGRLSTVSSRASVSSGSLESSPSGPYRGSENRLYRVEIHRPGPAGTATFKWSRDNASVGSPVRDISGACDQVHLASLGPDAPLHFAPDDWVEITDDRRELHGIPGEMAHLKDVNENEQVVALAASLVGPFDAADRTRRTRIRRWHHAAPGTGDAPHTDRSTQGQVAIPDRAGTVELEDGVEVSFEPGSFRTGDYWLIPARAADGSVDQLTVAPPQGPHHHYSRLALYDADAGTVEDCRTLWPPQPANAVPGSRRSSVGHTQESR
jgi:hypothetical protein